MKDFLVDVPVLLIFFTRPDTFKEVFGKVKQARPSKLFLACDGPRDNHPDDAEKIAECQKIAEDIDWDCEVHKNYAEKNMGCGMRPQSAISWAFEYVDRLVILEDDCVPDLSIFPYMENLLEKYKCDERVGVISGYNHFRSWDCGEFDYFFTKVGATLGWGTWKRVWDKYDYYIKDFDNPYYQKALKDELINPRAGEKRIAAWSDTRRRLTAGENISWWDHQFGFVKYLNSYLTIVPKENLIYNIGVGAGSSHAEHLSARKWRVGDVCFMPTGQMPSELNHPNHVICDREYDQAYFRLIAYPGFFRKVKNRLGRMWG